MAKLRQGKARNRARIQVGWMNHRTTSRRFASLLLYCAPFLLLLAMPAQAYAQEAADPDAIVRLAVQTELAAARNDHSRWRYRDSQAEVGKVSIVVQTDSGSVKRLISREGHPLNPTEEQQEEKRLKASIHDAALLARKRKDGEQDDKSAAELLTMLPTAFLWKIERQTPETITLHFDPNPSFNPPSLQSRVLAAMNGTLVVDKAQHRIETISGRLTQDVTFGLGLFGRLRQGGSFRVERRQLAPGLWQITETHVHIDGKALLFKDIGEQQDEVQTEYTQVPQSTTLEQAIVLSREKP